MRLSIYCGKQSLLENPYILFTDCDNLEDFLQNKRFKDLTTSQEERTQYIDDNNNENNFQYKILIKENDPKNPKWRDFIFNAIDQNAQATENPLSKSCSGVVLVKCRVNTETEKIFIVTFGSGSAYIDDYAVEEKFGLKIVLNAVSVKNLHLIDKKNIGSNTKQTKEAYAMPTNVKFFDINKMIDNVTFVEGSPEQIYQNTLGKKIGGRDSIIIDKQIGFAELGKLCRDCYQYFLLDEYSNKGFGFIDNYTDQLDSDIKGELNDLLRDEIENNPTNIFLAPKDIIQAIEQIENFEVSIGGATHTFNILNFEEIYNFISSTGRVSNLSDFSEKVKIQGKDADGNNLTTKTSLKKYIIFETNLGDNQYIFHEGIWYNIKQDYYNTIQTNIQDLQINNVLDNRNYLHYYKPTDINEGGYNVKQGDEDNFFCIDKNLFRGYGSGIEVGDLIYSENDECHLIHVKKYTSSATLSHLFAQGKVSHDALKQDPNYFSFFERSFNDGFSGGNLPANKDDIKTIFGIITNKTSLDELPFFSKINLLTTVTDIENQRGIVNFVFISID